MGPVEVVDYHTAGEPFRIVVGGGPELVGETVLEKRADALENHDEFRRLLINEPRGHADQYGCFVVDPNDELAAFGVIFFHKDGYSTACGHGTIAVATYAFESGLLPAAEGVNTLAIDVPSGRVSARVNIEEGRVQDATFVNVPAFVTATGIPIFPSDESVLVDVSYGGAFYASAAASDFGLTVTPDNVERFITLGRRIKTELADHPAVVHPSDDRLSGLYGVIFFEEGGIGRQRNITVFADGEVDRSPCGSGTSARLALLHADGTLSAGDLLIHESVIGTRFEGRVTAVVAEAGHEAVVTEVKGSAFETGRATFSLNPLDPVGLGFQLR